MYIWIHSPVVDFNDMKKAEFEVTRGKLKVKANLTNNLDGTFTGSVSMGQFIDSGGPGPGGPGPGGHKRPGSDEVKLKKLKIEDRSGAKYEIKNVTLTVEP
jgi:hypothetical protein